jgi:hypothetical protein
MTTISAAASATRIAWRLQQRIVALKMEHRDLDTAIARLEIDTEHDELQLRRLKRRKLLLKDQIARLERQLDPTCWREGQIRISSAKSSWHRYAPAQSKRNSSLTLIPLHQPGPAVLVVEADDVVLFDIVAARDFDDGEQIGAAVLQPVLRLDRNECRFAFGRSNTLSPQVQRPCRARRPSARCADGAAAATAMRRA